jgi:hypothetical protein
MEWAWGSPRGADPDATHSCQRTGYSCCRSNSRAVLRRGGRRTKSEASCKAASFPTPHMDISFKGKRAMVTGAGMRTWTGTGAQLCRKGDRQGDRRSSGQAWCTGHRIESYARGFGCPTSCYPWSDCNQG